jgi:hypothetical protein
MAWMPYTISTVEKKIKPTAHHLNHQVGVFAETVVLNTFTRRALTYKPTVG